MATWFIIVVPLSVMHACPTCPAVSSSTAGTNCSIFYFTDTCSFYSVQLTMSKIPTCLFLTHLVSSAYPTLSICISAWNLSESHITYKIIYLLLLSGDIELNAGPCHLDTINFYQLNIHSITNTSPFLQDCIGYCGEYSSSQWNLTPTMWCTFIYDIPSILLSLKWTLAGWIWWRCCLPSQIILKPCLLLFTYSSAKDFWKPHSYLGL